MEKIVLIVFIIINSSSCFSQENIYLIIKESPNVKIFRYQTDSIQNNQYIISLYVDKSRINYSIEDGILQKQIQFQ